jgi:hypothetical protein
VSDTLGGQAIIDAIESQMMELGLFDSINAHDPINPPGEGLTAAIWVQDITPLDSESGLDSVTLLFVINMRVYMLARAEPIDYVDPAMTSAVDQSMSSLAAGFTLGGLVRNIDLFGKHGAPFAAKYGYVSMSGTVYRAATITIPSVINDVWTEQA